MIPSLEQQKKCVGIRFKSHHYYDQEPFVKLSGFINTLFVHEFTFNNGLSSYYIDWIFYFSAVIKIRFVVFPTQVFCIAFYKPLFMILSFHSSYQQIANINCIVKLMMYIKICLLYIFPLYVVGRMLLL